MITHINRRIAGSIFLACLAVGVLGSTAHAQLIQLSVGGYVISGDGFSSANLSADPTAPADGGLATTTPGRDESAWGVFRVTTILSGGNFVYSSDGVFGPDNTQYWGRFYNEVDTSAVDLGPITGDPEIKFKSTGLMLDIYKIQLVPDGSGDAYWSNVVKQGIAGRTGTTALNSGFSGITSNLDLGGLNPGVVSSSLVLHSELIGNGSSTYNYQFLTTFNTGSLAITTPQSLFQVPAGYEFGPMTYAFTGNTGPAVVSAVGPNTGWDVKFGGQADGVLVPVPESSTYGLMAVTALAGVVGLRRRAQKNAARPVTA